MSEPAIQKTTLGQAVQMGLATPNGDRVYAVDAARACWIVWPECVDDPASVFLVEGDALVELDRITPKKEGEDGRE